MGHELDTSEWVMNWIQTERTEVVYGGVVSDGVHAHGAVGQIVTGVRVLGNDIDAFDEDFADKLAFADVVQIADERSRVGAEYLGQRLASGSLQDTASERTQNLQHTANSSNRLVLDMCSTWRSVGRSKSSKKMFFFVQ